MDKNQKQSAQTIMTNKISSKKIIHALTIIDKSSSMERLRGRTIEGINASINGLKSEVDDDLEIINTQLQFSATSRYWGVNSASEQNEVNFVFKHVGKNVVDIKDMTEADYVPSGGTPLLDAIGYGIEKVKEFHGDALGDDNLTVIVTIFTDGEENSSSKWDKAEIKKMIEHFSADDKWTFTFVGCGSFENVSGTSSSYGIARGATLSYDSTEAGIACATTGITTSYVNYARSVKSGQKDDTLFVQKVATTTKK